MFQRAFSSATYGKNILLQVERVKLLLSGQVKAGDLLFLILFSFVLDFAEAGCQSFSLGL